VEALLLVTEFLVLYHSDLLSLVILLCCYISITGSLIFSGREGLFGFSLIALIVSDFQVLCAAPFASYNGPLVLGTVMYSSMFLVNDLITEIYGLQAAKKNILMTLAGHIGLIGFLWLTLLHPHLPAEPENAQYISSRAALEQIFQPQIGIFLASQCAYFLSQWSDIHVFSHIRATLPKVLALRTVVPVFLGIIIDTLVFNFLAWELFTNNPIPLNVLWTDYIYANIVIQFIILFLNIPVFYGILWIFHTPLYPLWARLSIRIYNLWPTSRSCR
jgi:uncharacterized integral membrane protein (TIGR00697 family)